MSKIEKLNEVNKEFVAISERIAALEAQINAPKLHTFYVPEHARGRTYPGDHGIRYSGISEQDRERSRVEYQVVLKTRAELIEQHTKLIAEINSMPEYEGIEFSSVLGEVSHADDNWCCIL
jgi:uncharacterized protein involved in tolerance to divalent cations